MTDSDNGNEHDLDQKINGALNNYSKRILKQIEERFAAFEGKLTAPAPSEKTATATGDDPIATLKAQIEKQDRTLKEMQKREREALAKAHRAEVSNRLTTALKGKVLDDWLPDAVEKVADRVKDNFTFEKDGLELSFEEGVNDWINDPANKRFRPASKQATQARRVVTQVTAPVATTQAQSVPEANLPVSDRVAAWKASRGLS